MKINEKFKKVISASLVMLSLIAVTPVIAPTTVAYAAGTQNQNDDTGSRGNGLDKFDVTVDENGSMTVKGGGFNSSSSGAWNDFLKKYKNIIVGVGAVLTTTMVLIFMWLLSKLSFASADPRARKEIQIGLFITGISIAGLGSVTFIVGFLYSAFQ